MQNCMYMLFPKEACKAFIGLLKEYKKKLRSFVLLGFKQLYHFLNHNSEPGHPFDSSSTF